MSVWPSAIDYDPAAKCLRVAYDTGETFDLPAEYLRVESPSAEVRGHGTEERVIVPGRRHVGIIDIEPVGNYAVRIIFDETHDTGIFTWDYLHRLGHEKEARWNEYLAELEAKGLGR